MMEASVYESLPLWAQIAFLWLIAACFVLSVMTALIGGSRDE